MSSFFKKIFGADNADEEFDDFDKPMSQASAAVPASEISDDQLPEELLDSILDIINAQLPPIASQCIDRSAQRRYLATAMGSPLALFMECLKKKAAGELTGDRKKMQAELEALRAERKEFNAKREEQKAALMSEQRQRRALSDRNRDLEAKIDELDSQIEQHKLTIASMTNKMRVAEVTEGDSSLLREEIDTLRQQLTEKDNEITKLQETLEAAKSAPVDAEPRKTRKTRKPRQQYVPSGDDSVAGLDSLDWLLPGGAPAGHVGHQPDPEFGYQPPKQAPAPDSDAQLTLF